MTTETSAPTSVIPDSVNAMTPKSERAPEVRRLTSTSGLDEVLSVAGSASGALALSWVVYYRLLPVDGILGFVLIWYAVFIGLYALVTAQKHRRLDILDRTMSVVMHSAGALVIGALMMLVGFTIYKGVTSFRPNLLTETMEGVDVNAGLDAGGALHAMVGTLQQIGIATAITVPLGIGAAVYLNEVRGPLTRPLRMVVEAMSALPSVVAGLFIFATWILVLGFDRSGFAAALALSVMMLPIITRTAEVVLRLVPNGLREASYALGSSQWRTVWHVVLPTARPSLMTAVILGMARGIGETSPVLLTAGFTAVMNGNPFRDAQVSLPLFVFKSVTQPFDTAVSRAFGAAVVLMLVVLILFVTARIIGGRGAARSGR